MNKKKGRKRSLSSDQVRMLGEMYKDRRNSIPEIAFFFNIHQRTVYNYIEIWKKMSIQTKIECEEKKEGTMTILKGQIRLDF
jgi:predicted DNA-binding protein YlxM (UPF0122 family)